MNTILKYLKDQGGQFWGAFGQSYANALEKSRDRPLKEAMLKAQIGHQEAVNKKLNMDIGELESQNQGIAELTSILTTPQQTPVMTQPEGPATEQGMKPMPVQTGTMEKPIEMTDPKVRAALLKSGVKGEVLSQAAKAAFPSGGAAAASGVLFQDWDSVNAFMASQDYKKVFPHGSRTIMTKSGIQLQGINPVDVLSNKYHSNIAAGMDPQAAFENFKQDAFGKGAAVGAGQFAGKTAQEAEQPVNPMVPFAGQPQPQPGIAGGATAAPAPGSTVSPGRQGNETQAQQVQRMRKEAQTAGSAIPEGLAKQQRDYTTLLNTTIADIEGNLDDKFLGVRGFPGVQSLRENKVTGELLDKYGVVEKPSEREVIFRSALADASDLLLRARSGAQINEAEARRLEKLLPNADSDIKTFRSKLARFKHQVQESIANGKLFSNITRSQLQSGDTAGTTSPTPIPGGESEPPSGWRRRR